jgi:hypothetical protein
MSEKELVESLQSTEMIMDEYDAMGSGQAKTLIICAIMLKTGWI